MIITTRWYQDRTEQNAGLFLNESSHKKGLIIKPVGTGKSLDIAIISRLTNQTCLVVQPSKELLEQNLEKARIFGLDPTVYSASKGIKEISDLTYATPLSIASNPEHFKHFKIVIIDEAHIGMTNTLTGGGVSKKGKFNEFLDQIQPDKTIGLTATPIQLVSSRAGSELKMINRSMRSFWLKSDVIDITQIHEIKDDYWADMSVEIVEQDTSFLRLNSSGSEFTDESVIKQYVENGMDYYVLDKYYEMMDRGLNRNLTFLPSVEIALNLKKKNKDFEVVYDKLPTKERTAIIEAFKRGEIPNLLNIAILTTGFDDPYLTGIIMARETNSFGLYYQICGRAVRPIIKDGKIVKKQAVISDLTSNTKRFDSIDGITFEKNDYTNGWGMWNKDRLLTGYPFGSWDMPSRERLKGEYSGKGIINKNSETQDIILHVGKYKGKSLVDSFKKDTKYFVWMYENFDWTTKYNKPLHKPLKELIDKHLMHGK